MTSRSTSEAVELAALVPVTDLHQTPVPFEYDELSSQAKLNIRAVSRALDVRIQGVPEHGWAQWAPTEQDLRLGYDWDDEDKEILLGLQENIADQHKCMKQLSSRQDNGLASACQKARATPGRTEQDTDPDKENKGDRAEVASTNSSKKASNEFVACNTGKAPSVDELKSADVVRKWAQLSPHTDPPSAAVALVVRSPNAANLLTSIVTVNDPPTLQATVVGTLSDRVGTSFASQLMKTLLVPYFKTLNAPACREVMQATVKFAEQHWRPMITLFEEFSCANSSINGALAEVLVRVSAVLSIEGATEALRVYCNARWGEDGIRVVEALVVKCQDESGLAGIVVPSLERNVVGLEKSVRFGKLLLTVAKHVQGVAPEYEHVMEAITGRSKVFLAKRALTVLRTRKTKPG